MPTLYRSYLFARSSVTEVYVGTVVDFYKTTAMLQSLLLDVMYTSYFHTYSNSLTIMPLPI